MSVGTRQTREFSSWLFVAAMLILCGVLGALQYVWIGEVSVAEQERLRENLRDNLVRLSDAFNNEITRACVSLIPEGPLTPADALEREYAAHFAEWKASGSRPRLFRSFAIAFPREGVLHFKLYDPRTGVLQAAEWPETWAPLRDMLRARMPDGPEWRGQNSPPPDLGYLIEVPHLARRVGAAGRPFPPPGRREISWLIVELDPGYVRNTMLPELVSRYLGSNGGLDYRVEVVNRAGKGQRIYPASGAPIGAQADGSAGLFEIQYDQVFRRQGPLGFRGEGGRGRGFRGEGGRWEMRARHQAGSLQAVVDRARIRNLAVTSGILLLMLATVAALVRFTRRSQHLAELEMNFVAGVSHELRTPLTVIRTAAYNLRGKLAHNPAQVERYGALIQTESERLTGLVEEVLRFARAKSGQVLQKSEPVVVERVIRDSIESSKVVIDSARCVVETEIEPGLPPVQGDAMGLKHALQNLITNAAKYGADGLNWIGVTARRVTLKDHAGVEIRVSDKGPGIPEAEQGNIFDPFYRGKRALQDQIQGTGLGLSLVKGIVEAHGGSISVESEPAKGTHFIIRLPAPDAPEHQNELTDSLSRG